MALSGLASISPHGSAGLAAETVAVVAANSGLVRRLASALEADGLAVVARGWDARDLVVEHADEPSAVVFACAAPERKGALASVVERFAGSRIVVVAPSGGRYTARKVLRAGAAGLVLEDDVERALGAAVRGVCHGQASIPLQLAAGLEKPVLSSREKQVLGMVVMGFTNRQVADRLFLAESTVKSHLSAVFSKLGVRSRKEAAALVVDPDAGLGLGILAISDEAPGSLNGVGG